MELVIQCEAVEIHQKRGGNQCHDAAKAKSFEGAQRFGGLKITERRARAPRHLSSPSGFVFTLAESHAARIAKAEINKRPGHRAGFTWQGNLLITQEESRRLADAVQLVLTD